ncbi:GH1 family beta-glucosidase [Paenibacillus peoriae]|uniref:GH1 family beta-glucosidase n=1 Tax=Paenibacillus peoriae TaxID=59893 RepID=UPI0030CE3818
MTFHLFPKDFVWGVATSAYQIEGAWNADGKGPSIWDTFTQAPGKVWNNIPGNVACDHYHRYEEDIAHMKKLGIGSYRFSFSWSRILPEGTGRINDKGLDFYKRLVNALLENGISPNATIYHWDLPQSLEDRGGWTNRDIKDWFAEYAGLLFHEFNGLIPMWSTLNEPIAFSVGYGMGIFAPGRTSPKDAKAAMHHGLLAHGEGVQAFRAQNMENSQIGIVIDIWKRHAARDIPEDLELARNGNENAHLFFLNPIFKRRYSDYILEQMSLDGTLPDIRSNDMEIISQPIDYYGLNVYNRVIVSTDPELSTEKPVVGERKKHLGGNFMDNGAEFYPKAVYDAIKMLKSEYDISIPIYITENGTPNCSEEVQNGRIQDLERIRYLKGFLHWTHKAIEEGADIRGYYAWSLIDNYEWPAGFSSRFGLIHVNFETQERIWKDSANWYQRVIAENGIKMT